MSLSTTATIDPSLLREVRRLELSTRRSLSSDFIGRFRSSFRGSGLTFNELREYQPGDEVKSIHWKATARSSKVYVKSYLEERSLEVIIAVDMSASMNFGSQRSNSRRAVDFATLVSVLCSKSGDGVGLVLFSEGIKDYLPVSRRRTQLSRIILRLLDCSADGKKSDLASTLNYLRMNVKKGSIVFVVSDFFTPPFENELKALSVRHDVILVQMSEDLSITSKMANSGLVELVDSESGERFIIDSASRRVREVLMNWGDRGENLKLVANRAGADFIQLIDNSYQPLLDLMQKRARRLR